MTSVVDIWNQALGAAGATGKLTSTSQNTREAEVCALTYDDVLARVFSAASWGSLRRTARLTLVKERDFDLDWTDEDPEPNWRYAYRLPAGFVHPRYLDGWGIFSLATLGEEIVLQSDTEEAVLTYTHLVEDPMLWEPLLRSMVIITLADAVARPLRVSNDAYRRVALAFDQTYQSVLTLQANRDNPATYDSIPDWITIRAGGYFDVSSARYFYPNQVLVNGYGQAQLQRG